MEHSIIQLAVMSKDPDISIIVPVYNGGEKFKKCLLSIMEATRFSKISVEIIVVADGESDGSWQFVQQLGLEVIKLEKTKGPAHARNVGALKAKSPILFFIDADVIIKKTTLTQVELAFQNFSDMAALFGSYDDQPTEGNLLSQYKNLFHHYTHQTASTDASTFWSGCGAVRRSIFLEVGGFNENYRFPSVEDIAIGFQLKKAGYEIRLMKDIQVRHMKRWEAVSLVKTDFLHRALPWSRLIIKNKYYQNDLNLKYSSRFSVIMLYMILGSSLMTCFEPWCVIGVICFMGGLLLLNHNLYRFFWKKRSLLFTIKIIPWHWFYFFYCGLAIGITYIDHMLSKFYFWNCIPTTSKDKFAHQKVRTK